MGSSKECPLTAFMVAPGYTQKAAAELDQGHRVALCVLGEITADKEKPGSRDVFSIKFILICETSRKYLGKE